MTYIPPPQQQTTNIEVPIKLGKQEKTEIKIDSETFFKSSREKWIFFAFIMPPLAISIISMLHMISLFETSDSYWMAVSIAGSVEIASMSSLVALAVLKKINKTTIWILFGTLACLQIAANMFHAYINISQESIQKILELFALEKTLWSVRFVMFLISGILPVIALAFVKGLVDYFKE